MKAQIVDRSEFEAGLFFVLVGTGSIYVVSGYTIGTAARMGPGYFPVMLGLILAAIGVVLLGRSILLSGPAEPSPRIEGRSAAIILASILAFGVLLRSAGMVLAILVLVLVASMAAEDRRLKRTLLLSLSLSLFCYLIFVVGLRLPLPILPAGLR